MNPLDFKRGGQPPQDVTDAPTPLDVASPPGKGGKEAKPSLQTIDSKLDAIMALLAGGAGAPPPMPPAPPMMPPGLPPMPGGPPPGLSGM